MLGEAAQVRQVDVREQRRGEPLANGALPPFLDAEQVAYQLLNGIVAARFERGNQPCHAVTAGRGYVLIAHDAEAVGRKHKVETRNGTQHRLVRHNARCCQAHWLVLAHSEQGRLECIADELLEQPPLGGFKPRQHLVEEGRLALRRGKSIGQIPAQLLITGY